MKLTEEQRLRLIEILEDEMHRNEKIFKRRGANRIELGLLEEIQELIGALKK